MQLLDLVSKFELLHKKGEMLQVRVGLHSGTCVTGELQWLLFSSLLNVKELNVNFLLILFLKGVFLEGGASFLPVIIILIIWMWLSFEWRSVMPLLWLFSYSPHLSCKKSFVWPSFLRHTSVVTLARSKRVKIIISCSNHFLGIVIVKFSFDWRPSMVQAWWEPRCLATACSARPSPRRTSWRVVESVSIRVCIVRGSGGGGVISDIISVSNLNPSQLSIWVHFLVI